MHEGTLYSTIRVRYITLMAFKSVLPRVVTPGTRMYPLGHLIYSSCLFQLGCIVGICTLSIYHL